MTCTYTYHGHACFTLEGDGVTLLFDPFLTDNPVAKAKPEDDRREVPDQQPRA